MSVESTWAEFKAGMMHRFGDSEQAVMTRIQHRKQLEDESIQSYADDMILMFAQSGFPEIMKRDLLLDGLKPSLRKKVLASIPSTVQDVIDNAMFLENKAHGAAQEKMKAWEEQRHYTKRDPIECITRSMDKLSGAVLHLFNKSSYGDVHA